MKDWKTMPNFDEPLINQAIGSLHPKAAALVGLAANLGFSIKAMAQPARGRRGVLLLTPREANGAIAPRPIEVQPTQQWQQHKLQHLYNTILTWGDPHKVEAYKADRDRRAGLVETPAPKPSVTPSVKPAAAVPCVSAIPAYEDQPATAHESTGSKGGGTGYRSPVAVQRRWSDGHVEIICAAVGCDYSRHADPARVGAARNPLASVGTHWARRHGRATPRKFPQVPFTKDLLTKDERAARRRPAKPSQPELPTPPQPVITVELNERDEPLEQIKASWEALDKSSTGPAPAGDVLEALVNGFRQQAAHILNGWAHEPATLRTEIKELRELLDVAEAETSTLRRQNEALTTRVSKMQAAAKALFGEDA